MDFSKMVNFVVLAAGKGTRMYSDLPKVMHHVAGTPMINVLLNEMKLCNPHSSTLVVAQEGEQVITESISNIELGAKNFVIQKERLGTGHAAKLALEKCEDSELAGVLVILYGDTPFIRKETVFSLQEEIKQGNVVSVVGFDVNRDNQYGRLVTDSDGRLTEIVEYSSADEQQKNITLCNSGIMALDLRYAKKLLDQIDNKNIKEEYYLTDVVSVAVKEGLRVSYIRADESEVQGVNNKIELAKANDYYYALLRKRFLEKGVTLIDPDTIYLADDVVVGKDVIIEPNVVILKGVVIADNVRIKSFSYIEEASIGDNVSIGPFARIRPGSKIYDEAKVGNFVEVKNSVIGKNSKVSHLSYIGDAELEEDVNIGAGTITCNYDGYNKYKTKIEKNVFVGSNTALVAPVKVGNGAIVGAGSAIIRDIPSNSITIARSEQKDILGGADKYRNSRRKKTT